MDKVEQPEKDKVFAAQQSPVDSGQDGFVDKPDQVCNACDERPERKHEYDISLPEGDDITSIVLCAEQLRFTVEAVLERIREHPSSKRVFQIFTCVLLDNIQKVEELLNNKHFGLKEIKHEVRCIENEVKQINGVLCDPKFSFQNDIGLIEELLTNKYFGLKGIRGELKEIEDYLSSKHFGLKEIKEEVRGIEKGVTEIHNSVNNPSFGLSEIKHEIRFIAKMLTNECYGLEEIKYEVEEIDDLLNNRIFGLREIKREIRFIENEVMLINNTVNAPLFGLNGARGEIQFVGDAVSAVSNEVLLINSVLNQVVSGAAVINGIMSSPFTGLDEIRGEVAAISDGLNNNTTDLNSILNEVLAINNTVNSELRPVFDEVRGFRHSMSDPQVDLSEVKDEIRFVENEVATLNSTVEAINNTMNNGIDSLSGIIENVAAISERVSDHTSGLAELKGGIQLIEDKVAGINTAVDNVIGFLSESQSNVTSGLIFVDNSQTAQVAIAVLSPAAAVEAVRIRVLCQDACPGIVLLDTELFFDDSGKKMVSADLAGVASYTIEVLNLVPGMTVAAVERTSLGAPVAGTRLTASQFISQPGD